MFRKLGLALLTTGLSVLLVAGPTPALARETAVQTPPIAWTSLPQEARATDQLIRAGGPFPHGKDGVVFGNRERRLPSQARGYYREYTVPTPGARDRGARRIVCGGPEPRNPEACYYTDNHYASFRRIVQ